MKREEKVRWLRDLLCGALIGAGAILPGVSGGVLAVVFDIYRPFMEVLAHPKTALGKYRRWILPLVLGWCSGFWIFAKGIAAAIHLSASVTTWLFIGLIVGTVPSLYKEAGKQGRSCAAWVAFALCGGAVFAGLIYMQHVIHVSVTPNFWWYTFCGVLWGLGIVVPGMTSSSVMMALGLYQPMLEGLSRMDVSVLLSTVPGLVLTIVLLARLVMWIFRHWYSVAFHGIFGVVVASALAIVPTSYRGTGEIVLSALCCGGGFLLAYLLARLDNRTGETT